VLRPRLEVADVFRRFGPAWRAANAGHLSLAQRRVMKAVELCRTAELGGHVERCADCAHTRVAYNSCRNRHCPKCQWGAAQAWLEAREAELLPVPHFHVVFTLPAELGALAYQNKARVYDLLLKTAAATLTTIAADPKHLGARIGVVTVRHSWGQTLDHHPHVHCIVPAGGISPDGSRWVSCRPGFFLPVRVLSRLFRRLFLDGLAEAYHRGEIELFGALAGLKEPGAFQAHLAAQRRREWVVHAKAPFAGPKQVRRSRCTMATCPAEIFAERLGDGIAAPFARRTARLERLAHHLALALGGRPGARLATRLLLPTSRDTLLRTLRRRAGRPARRRTSRRRHRRPGVEAGAALRHLDLRSGAPPDRRSPAGS
jgi:hypothetical protein